GFAIDSGPIATGTPDIGTASARPVFIQGEFTMRICGRAPLLASLASMILALSTAGVQAASPRLTLIQPWGGQRGTEIDVVFVGSNLEDAEQVMLYDQGLEVVSMELAKDKEGKSDGKRLNIKFKIAENCPLGTQRIR